MTLEQLEAARAERMRQNGHGAITLEDARTWMEETGLCLFLPRRQFSSSLAPSFVEAVAGQRNHTPDPQQIAVADELLVRLETDGVAVRLNLLGQPGEQPDYVVAAWVLPYVYALRGDRDWRRSPQLTGSRQVSPLAIQAYKHLEAGDATIADLKQALGHGVTESAVLRAITELWQQLRILPVVSAPGKAAKWQLLRQRFQKAIAEGASTSQVTAISVLASIYLQAVIAAGMEEVEIFLSPLTARSKIREVLRGLVATRQVHTLSLGHAPHFYVAGTLPEFAVSPTVYASSVGASYFSQFHEQEEIVPEPVAAPIASPIASIAPIELPPVEAHVPVETHVRATAPVRRTASNGKPGVARPQFNRPAAHARDRKTAQSSSNGHPARRTPESRPARPAAGGRSASSTRWNGGAPKNTTASRNGTASRSAAASRNGNGTHGPAKGAHTNGTHDRASNGARSAKPAAWPKRAGGHPASAGKAASASRSAGLNRGSAVARKDSRSEVTRSGRKPAVAAGASAGKRFGFAAKNGTKKRG